MASKANIGKPLPSQEELAKLIRYEPASGKIYWMERSPANFPPSARYSPEGMASRYNTKHAGKECGCVGKKGYIELEMAGAYYAAHRLIWKLLKGYDPMEIDHIDGDKANNRIENLRSVCSLENSRNKGLQVNSKHGHLGVSFHGRDKKWQAAIRHGGKTLHLGYFDEKSDAVAARLAAETKLGYHENHGRLSVKGI